ncbi:MAG: transferrin-binding protein-like solute binding protein [Alphaproteobacteria bacterium]
MRKSKAYAFLRSAAPVVALLLSACGGGGGGGGSPLPYVPTPTPTPTPTPSPTYPTFPLTASASFDTINATRWFDRSGGRFNMIDLSVTGRGSSGVNIGYDASTGSYTISAGDLTRTFTSAERSSNGYFDVYTSGNSVLTLFNNVRAGASQAGAPIKLSYLSFGSYRVDDPTDNNLLGLHFGTYFLFGYPTETADMPRSGTASYSTAVFGSYTGMNANDPITSFTGSATFTADFGTSTVSTALTLPFARAGSSSSTYNGSGAISGNEFSGQFTSSTDPYFSSGSFAGGFFGPAAEEMGYTFTLTTGGGATDAPPPISAIGVAVGTKNGQ